MLRVTLAGESLAGMEIEQPAASVRLLIPSPGADELVIPTWNGNEFLLPDGSRPTIRTFTPRRLDGAACELDLDLVIHDGGVVSAWVQAAAPGDSAAMSGPGRGFEIDPSWTLLVLAGDETAVPAISQLLEATPSQVEIHVHLEAAADFGTVQLPTHPSASVEWHALAGSAERGALLLDALRRESLMPETHVWCAGEAAAMHRIRQYLFKQLELPRNSATVRGYWKRRQR
jgi:NADPH-dependent ferric siderophore reductase